MSFITDKQTLTDLNLLGKFKTGSMFNLFNRVKTRGAELLLEEMFRSPLADKEAINARAAKINYLKGRGVVLDIAREHTEDASHYLSESRPANRFVSLFNAYRQKTQEVMYRSELYYQQQKQILAVQEVLLSASNLLGQLFKKDNKENNPCVDLQNRLDTILNAPGLKNLRPKYPYTVSQTAECQYVFRNRYRNELEELLRIVYEFDVYLSVADVAENLGLVRAEAITDTGNSLLLHAVNLRHPSLAKAIGNNLALTSHENLLFLTGANMAGKSTWMKTLGISFYLAHMGFPVAAEQMRFKVMEGILTSINVPDDLSQGWSHFYAEVMRVKQVAEQLSKGKRLFILFDELFKGTNVKDAFDATLAVTEKLAQYHNCSFVISTHIIEVGEELKGTASILFKYMPTEMEGSVPKYTYQMKEGITSDRQGMIIIENERILEMLN
jgi:DNA mismatch repair protein MutS